MQSGPSSEHGRHGSAPSQGDVSAQTLGTGLVFEGTLVHSDLQTHAWVRFWQWVPEGTGPADPACHFCVTPGEQRSGKGLTGSVYRMTKI